MGTCEVDTNPSLVMYFVRVYGVHGSPRKSSPDSIISFHDFFMLLGVGLHGIDISPPGNRLCCDLSRLSDRLSSATVSIPLC